MKTRTFLFIALFLLSCRIASSKEADPDRNPPGKNTVDVAASPVLFSLTEKWAIEYCKSNPEVEINVIQSSDHDIAGKLNTNAEFGFISEESYALTNTQATWKVVVGRDVIVPVMNASNPLLEDICRKGITSQRLSQMTQNPDDQNWSTLLGEMGKGTNFPLHIYVQDDASVISGVSEFLNSGQLNRPGIQITGAQEMIQTIQKDPKAMGFCKLTQIIDSENQNINENLRLIPIDKNGNGKIDYMEDIYENLQSFSRGVWIGKYPDALSNTIYAVSSAKPEGEEEVAFMKWVLTEGQQYLAMNGYSELMSGERLSQLDKIGDTEIYTPPSNANYALLILIFIVVFIVAGLIVDWVVRSTRRHKPSVADVQSSCPPVAFDVDSLVAPNGIYFDRSHTWAFMKKDGTVKVGIDDFLQHVAGRITRVELKKAGENVRKGERLLTIIQNGKQLNIYAPLSGTIIAHNKELNRDASLVNAAPYDEGWVYMIEPANWLRDIQFLSMAEKYKTWLKAEFSRLKDFFAAELNVDSPEYANVVLQDGGALKDNILAELGPEVWEDFQTQFIDCVC